jgi:hypothetical protein
MNIHVSSCPMGLSIKKLMFQVDSLVSKRLQKFLKFAWKYSEKEKEIYNMYIQNFP